MPPESTYTTDEERWNAIVTKDTDATSVFLYAVSTTNIYCRPGCRSRLPLRRNVQFYEVPPGSALCRIPGLQEMPPQQRGRQ
jgi:AraC family transcriptional regulator of adaptative response/methylated-DNA-[protein]-cysteine methyltransferase